MKVKNKYIIVAKPKLVELSDHIELSADITSSDGIFSSFKLWYRFPLEFQDYITLNGDPFLAALLPIAMKKNYDLRLKTCISERLYINTRQVMKIFSRWFDNMEPVNIEPKYLQSDRYNPKAVGSFFTGGVDSFYTVLKNLDFYENESRITHLLYVYGFDVNINNGALFEKIHKHLKVIADELQLQLLLASTNLRKFTDSHISWGKHEYGAALASVGLSMPKLFKTILIPSGHPYAEVYATAINPLLDPLWSNESTQFMEDGNEADRNQKIEWQLSKKRLALRHLRVCWQNPNNSYNCGKCAKCLRTKISLHLAGVLEQCETFDNNIDFELYAKKASKNSKERRMIAESLDYVKLNSSDKKIEEGLKYVLANTREHTSLKRRVKNIDKNYLNGGLRKLFSLKNRLKTEL